MDNYRELIEERKQLLAKLGEIEAKLPNSRDQIMRDREDLCMRHNREIADLTARHDAEKRENDELLKKAGFKKVPRWPKTGESEVQWLDAQTRPTRARMRGKHVKTDPEYKRQMAAARLTAMLMPEYAKRFQPDAVHLGHILETQVVETCSLWEAKSVQELAERRAVSSASVQRYMALAVQQGTDSITTDHRAA